MTLLLITGYSMRIYQSGDIFSIFSVKNIKIGRGGVAPIFDLVEHLGYAL
jgi:hypothetical protein